MGVRLGILFLCCVGGVAYGASWTNTAGHAVEAELVGRRGDLLVLERKCGERFTMARSALSAESRREADRKFPRVARTHREVVTQRNEQRLKKLQQGEAQGARGMAEKVSRPAGPCK